MLFCVRLHFSLHTFLCVGCLFVCSFLSFAIDTNECLERSHDCSKYALCHNKLGAHDCVCLRGYDGDGKVCKGKPLDYFAFYMMPQS